MTNLDLPNFAADKVRKALNDVHQVAADPGEMLRIALMGAGICIGQASGVLHGMMKNAGTDVSEREVKEQIFELLRTATIDGADAVMQMLKS